MNPFEISGQSLYIVNGDQLKEFGKQCANVAVEHAQHVWQQQHDAQFDPVFTKKKVADMFDVDVRTIEAWIAKKIIRPTKIGGVIRIDGNEIVRIKQMYKQH